MICSVLKALPYANSDNGYIQRTRFLIGVCLSFGITPPGNPSRTVDGVTRRCDDVIAAVYSSFMRGPQAIWVLQSAASEINCNG